MTEGLHDIAGSVFWDDGIRPSYGRHMGHAPSTPNTHANYEMGQTLWQCSRLLREILIGWHERRQASSDPGRVATPPRMHLSGSPAAARSRFLHALCTLASSFKASSVSTMPARQLGSLAPLRQSRRDSRMDGNTERSCRLVPFVTRSMDRSLGGVMPRGMNGLDGTLLMQDDKNSGQGLRRGGPRPSSGKDTRCTPAYRMFTANRCCPWVWEGDGAQSGVPIASWKGHATPDRYLG